MSSIRTAKGDAPPPREYRALKRAAKNKVTSKTRDNRDFRLECEFVLRTLGELGMRAGEIAHMRDEWIDYESYEIVIPSNDPCNMGQDGGPCGYCKDRAKDSAKKFDDLTYETALRKWWKPKNEHGARTIPYGWYEELIDVIEEYMNKHGMYPRSRVSVNRRIKTIAKACDLVDPDDMYPHALRAHAAEYHARKGIRAYHLSELMGWGDIGSAMDYIKSSAIDLETEITRIHNGAGQ